MARFVSQGIIKPETLIDQFREVLDSPETGKAALSLLHEQFPSERVTEATSLDFWEKSLALIADRVTQFNALADRLLERTRGL